VTAYPNKEHERADEGARRRAMDALTELAGEAALLRRRLADGRNPDYTDAESLERLVRKLTRDLSVLGTLREVREWDAADKAGEAATAAGGEK